MRAFLIACVSGALLLLRGDELTVIDGDTVRTSAGETIRILNIDTPETWRSRCQAEYVLGKRAAVELSKLLVGENLQVERHGHDRYGRTLARLVGRKGDLGELLIKAGYALPYEKGPAAKARRLAQWCQGASSR